MAITNGVWLRTSTGLRVLCRIRRKSPKKRIKTMSGQNIIQLTRQYTENRKGCLPYNRVWSVVDIGNALLDRN